VLSGLLTKHKRPVPVLGVLLHNLHISSHFYLYFFIATKVPDFEKLEASNYTT